MQEDIQLTKGFKIELNNDKEIEFSHMSSIQQTAQTIVEQIGGIGRLKAMTGAYNFLVDEKENALSFRVKGSRSANYIKIRLNSMDLYDLKTSVIRHRKTQGFTQSNIQLVAGIYAEDLKEQIEQATGLYLNL